MDWDTVLYAAVVSGIVIFGLLLTALLCYPKLPLSRTLKRPIAVVTTVSAALLMLLSSIFFAGDKLMQSQSITENTSLNQTFATTGREKALEAQIHSLEDHVVAKDKALNDATQRLAEAEKILRELKKQTKTTSEGALEARLHTLEDDVVAKNKALKEAWRHLAVAEKSVQDLQELINLKSKWLAELSQPLQQQQQQQAKWAEQSPSRGGTPDIVYNADLTPQLSRDSAMPNRAVLQAGQPIVLRFNIGPKWPNSILFNIEPSQEILQSKEDVRLSVVLSCGFCEPHADSLKRMTFRPGEGRSDEIRFQFSARRPQGGNSYIEKLHLSIINDKTGREFDHIVIPVAVADNSAPAPSGQIGALVITPSSGLDRTDWQPDVLLYANEEMGRNVSISIEPVSAEMKSRLGPLAFDAEGMRRVFRSGIDDAQLIDAMTNSAYGAMSAVSLQGEFLKQLSASGTDAAVSKVSQNSLVLSDTESKNVTSVIAKTGQRLYRHLFYSSADTSLRKLVTEFETAAAEPRDRPLRLVIVTNRLSLPWQYLHPVGPDINAAKFWGLQFSLSVLRVNNNAPEKAVAQSMDQARKVIFARYGSSADPTVPLAEKQVLQLLSLPLATADLLKVDTGTELLGKLSAERSRIAGIVTFLHASAGSPETEPQLQFNDGDLVNSSSFDDLLSKVADEQQDSRYLAGAPLVILNACETGPSRHLPHVKLENAMFALGARGVVVTEVSVWISLGHEVAMQLLSRLSKGETVSDSLTAVRRELFFQKKNPLGLLYVYYGDPTAKLRH